MTAGLVLRTALLGCDFLGKPVGNACQLTHQLLPRSLRKGLRLLWGQAQLDRAARHGPDADTAVPEHVHRPCSITVRNSASSKRARVPIRRTIKLGSSRRTAPSCGAWLVTGD